jgi:hypothetical protein
MQTFLQDLRLSKRTLIKSPGSRFQRSWSLLLLLAGVALAGCLVPALWAASVDPAAAWKRVSARVA